MIFDIINIITKSMRELDRLNVIQTIVETGLKPGRAAERPECSAKSNGWLRYQESGAAGLASGKRGFAGSQEAHELRDRLVKALRLRGIQTIEVGNASASSFIGLYNVRFAKPPRSEFDAHRRLRDDENLYALLTWRDMRRQ
jgi:hypothetical protein